MTKVIFPGSFDPIHLGHVDIARRASEVFDEVVVAVYDKPSKHLLFTPSERIRMAKECLKEIKNITVVGYSGLTINFAKEVHAKAIVRGLRVFSDYEYEFRMALANHRLNDEIDTIALITAEENMFISSTTVKEIASFSGDVSSMVPPLVEKALKNKYKTKDTNEI
ncbi:MAG TPA: pantetheine-phosphate adenylyltransferase [Anaerolineaceae bacterium]|nr:pantetheine-phosphate adenylyltransferase [Anaerolineaceae bacterium]